MADTKPRAGSYLECQPSQTRKASIDIVPGAVLSPITELTWNFEHNSISSAWTPKRKLSLSCSDNAATPSPSHQRTSSSTSNESGYCPGTSPPSFGFDSPSLEVLKSAQERRRQSQTLIQHQRFLRRWNSSPVETGDNKENINLFGVTTIEKEDSPGEGFKFVQPKDLATRRHSVSTKYAPRCLPTRSLSDPSSQGFHTESSVPVSPANSDSQDSGATDFDFDGDGDDDGFMDIVQEEQEKGNKSDVPSGMEGLLCAPLVYKEDSPETDKNDAIAGTGETPKPAVSNYKPRDLFNTASEKSEGRGAETSVSGSPAEEKDRMRPRSKSFALKRPNPPRDTSPMEKKRLRQRCMSVNEGNSRPVLVELPNILGNQTKHSPLQRSQSATFEYHQKIEHTLSTATRDTIGDFSQVQEIDERSGVFPRKETKYRYNILKFVAGRATHTEENMRPIDTVRFDNPYILPTIPGKSGDLKCLSPETVAGVVTNQFPEIVTAYIIDCRYPYEYEAGHIKGAINIYIKDDMTEQFLKNPKCEDGKRVIIIFHCEFSSKRGPDMSRFLRRNDRDLHVYPKLYYPELYLLEGGYRAFFQEHKELCEPQHYLPMLDVNYTQDLKLFSKKSKSWCEGAGRKSMRPGLNYRC